MNISEIKTELTKLTLAIEKLENKENHHHDIVTKVVNYIQDGYFIADGKPYLSESNYDDEVTVRLEIDEMTELNCEEIWNDIKKDLDVDESEHVNEDFVENPDE
tara:strand:+ start:3443 stop:3754 length:312 start_codon:yes stop_codon:yes gene_type:complete